MACSTPIDELRDRSPAAWLRERGIDLLICSEPWAEGSPLRTISAGRWNDGTATFDGAWVSHQDADGETDIVVSFISGPESLVLLVENKIYAEFQPDQPERYRQRGMRWRERGGAICQCGDGTARAGRVFRQGAHPGGLHGHFAAVRGAHPRPGRTPAGFGPGQTPTGRLAGRPLAERPPHSGHSYPEAPKQDQASGSWVCYNGGNRRNCSPTSSH